MKDGISIVMAYNNRRYQLARTLVSINKTKYPKDKIQIIIVDDCSVSEHSIVDLPSIFGELEIKIVNITEKQKKWVNPGVTYNIGFNHIKYDKVIIQNPECYHQGDILMDVGDNLNSSVYNSYACYTLNAKDSLVENFNEIELLNRKWELDVFGRTGWNNHSQYNRKFYHYCSSLTYENLYKINGFDERYKDGVCFDDDEIIMRLENLGLEMIIIDSPFVFHQHHESFFRADRQETEEDKQKMYKMYYDNKNLFETVTMVEKKYRAVDNIYFNK